MTVDVHSSSPATPWGDLGDVGLEDASAADIQMPRIQIVHEEGVFKDASTGEKVATLDCVILGLIKQRIMWDSQVDEGDRPQCKSPDFEHGYPQMRTDIPTRKQFPWDKSNFNKADFPPNDDGQIVLPCESCKLKDWGKERTDKPLCSEQYTYGLYYRDANGVMRPGLLSLQRSGIKAARTYTGTFAAARQPMFTVWTSITLRQESRGKVIYAVPTFAKGGTSDASEWQNYAEQYRGLRDLLRAAPRAATKEADEAEASSRGAARPPASAAAATALKEDDPWAAPSSTSSADDDLPF